MYRLRHRIALRRCIGVAVLALLLGPWAALVHSIDHRQAPAAAAASDGTDHAWSHPAGTSTCQLIDHLLTGQAPGGEPATATCMPPAAVRVTAPAPSAGPGLASRAYEARGPPRA